MLKDKDAQTSEGLNQIFEIINAKGDTGELKKKVEKSNNDLDREENDAES